MATKARAALVVASLALIAAGCGGSSKSSTKPTTATGSSDGKSLPLWDENRKMSDTSGYDSPIASALGYDQAQRDPAALQAQSREMNRKREEAIVDCMKAQGFEYKPQSLSETEMASQPPGYDLTRKEYVEKYGFGISTTVEDSGSESSQSSAQQDPNATYMESLSESERQAYQKALYGDMPMGPSDTSDDSSASSDSGGAAATTAVGNAYEPKGCMGEAIKAMQGGTRSTEDRAFMEDMQKRLQTFYEKLQADPRVVAANRTYASCMASKGYPEIDKQETAYEKVSEKMNEVYQSEGRPPDTTQGGAAETMAPSGPSFDQAKLAEVKAYEIAVAKADLACGKDVMKASLEVSQELEKTFVEQNKADLARYKELNKGFLGG